jgi:hypothetical protein
MFKRLQLHFYVYLLLLGLVLSLLLAACGDDQPINYPGATLVNLDGSYLIKAIGGNANRQSWLTYANDNFKQFISALANYAKVAKADGIDWSKIRIDVYSVTNNTSEDYDSFFKEVKTGLIGSLASNKWTDISTKLPNFTTAATDYNYGFLLTYEKDETVAFYIGLHGNSSSLQGKTGSNTEDLIYFVFTNKANGNNGSFSVPTAAPYTDIPAPTDGRPIILDAQTAAQVGGKGQVKIWLSKQSPESLVNSYQSKFEAEGWSNKEPINSTPDSKGLGEHSSTDFTKGAYGTMHMEIIGPILSQCGVSDLETSSSFLTSALKGKAEVGDSLIVITQLNGSEKVDAPSIGSVSSFTTSCF